MPLVELEKNLAMTGGVQVMWCHFHFVSQVSEGSIPKCTCFHSENILVTLTLHFYQRGKFSN